MRYGRNSYWKSSALFAHLSQDTVAPPVRSVSLFARSISRDCLPEVTTSDDTVNAMPLTVPTDSSLWTSKFLNYAKALHLLKTNDAEQRLDVDMPYSMYLELEKSWSKYPQLSYNTLEQLATVLRSLISISLQGYLSTHASDDVRRVVDSGTPTKRSSQGQYFNSKKEPDGSFSYYGDRRTVLLVTIESGFTEDYTGLRMDKSIWIDGMSAKVVILICLKESPRFKNPVTLYEDIEDIDVALERMRQNRGTYGPFEHQSHRWFGRLSDAWIEVWRANMKDPVITVSTNAALCRVLVQFM
ncbi:hypothetical protein V1525DRAFT_426236 [Lipomyces kononenkoae]|uniref:Uncharacterized protein n=1 Tax=Lipomyces kononenkoae TaxID=34357 RepID=A0ACC3T361_LIPKO